MRSIDIHAHLTPQCFWRTTEGSGDWHTVRREQDARGRQYAVVGGRRQELPPRARWTPEERLADMDSLGVDIHVVSPYSGFYNYHLDTAIAVATSHDANNEIRDMITSWPDRFAGLATLPMQDVPAAIAELERVMVQLGFKGAMINDQVNGRTLDDPMFLPFWKAAEQLGALILFHQGGGTIVSSRHPRYHLPNTIGNLVERTVTFASWCSAGSWTPVPISKSAFRTAVATPAMALAAWTTGGGPARRHVSVSSNHPARICGAFTTIASSTRSRRYAISSIPWESTASSSAPTGPMIWSLTGRSRGS